jgi:hypothetical protein
LPRYADTYSITDHKWLLDGEMEECKLGATSLRRRHLLGVDELTLPEGFICWEVLPGESVGPGPDWWEAVLSGDAVRQIVQALEDLSNSRTERIEGRTAVVAILLKLGVFKKKLPSSILRYMLDCQVAQNSLEFRQTSEFDDITWD